MGEIGWIAAKIAGAVLLVPLLALAFAGLRRNRTAAMRREIETRAAIYGRGKGAAAADGPVTGAAPPPGDAGGRE